MRSEGQGHGVTDYGDTSEDTLLIDNAQGELVPCDLPVVPVMLDHERLCLREGDWDDCKSGLHIPLYHGSEGWEREMLGMVRTGQVTDRTSASGRPQASVHSLIPGG